jgi:hypothetical protein
MGKKKYDTKKAVFSAVIILLTAAANCTIFVFAVTAAEEPYSVISQKNLFSPERKEWIMQKADAGKGTDSKKIPQFDPKLISLDGTVLAGEATRALISTKSGRQEKGSVYMVGDYVEGFLIKSIEQRQIVLTSPAVKEDYTVFLNAKREKRSAQTTEGSRGLAPATTGETSKAARAERLSKGTEQGEGVKTSLGDQKAEKKPSTKSGKQPVESKWASSDTLNNRMQSALDILNNKEIGDVRLQAERDYKKLQSRFPDMTPQERQKIITQKKKIDSTTSKK